METKSSTKILMVTLVLILASSMLLVGYYYGKSSVVCPHRSILCNDDDQAEEIDQTKYEAETTDQDSTDQKEAQNILDQFQSFQTDRQAQRVISMITDPETAKEENDLAALSATEGFGSADRLYSANELTFNLVDYEISNIEKIDDSIYWFHVNETRKLWDQTTGDWTNETYQYQRKFEIEKDGNDWMINKYSAIEDEGKYSGFYNTN